MDLNPELLRLNLEAVEGDARLREEAVFSLRAKALEDLEIGVLDALLPLDPALTSSHALAMRALAQRANALQRELEAVDESLFRRMRMEIRDGSLRGKSLRALIAEYVPLEPRREAEVGYDLLDTFLDGLFDIGPVGEETSTLESEMVSHQKTPARVVLELAARARFVPGDVFYDLGSGLGQVPILVHLLADARDPRDAKAARAAGLAEGGSGLRAASDVRGLRGVGVEIEPAYCEAARLRAAGLGADVAFVNADVREADLSDGTVFFLYTPFRGKILDEVLEKLRALAAGKPIRIFTYGPCSEIVARCPWLRRENEGPIQAQRLEAFGSL